MGTNRLATELFIYSAGLFPLLCNAALNVRSILLSIYETHFVPLGQRLRPALNGFLSGDHLDSLNFCIFPSKDQFKIKVIIYILVAITMKYQIFLITGVLPGLEEGSEHYQKTNNLLESVAEAVHPQVSKYVIYI